MAGKGKIARLRNSPVPLEPAKKSVLKNFTRACRGIRNLKNIGSRTGKDVIAGKNIKKLDGKFENFDDYWSECSENDDSSNITNHFVSSSVDHPDQQNQSTTSRMQCLKRNTSQTSSQATYLSLKNIGSRTGKDLRAGRNIRIQDDGYENFDDYWTDTDVSSSYTLLSINEAEESRYSSHPQDTTDVIVADDQSGVLDLEQSLSPDDVSHMESSDDQVTADTPMNQILTKSPLDGAALTDTSNTIHSNKTRRSKDTTILPEVVSPEVMSMSMSQRSVNTSVLRSVENQSRQRRSKGLSRTTESSSVSKSLGRSKKSKLSTTIGSIVDSRVHKLNSDTSTVKSTSGSNTKTKLSRSGKGGRESPDISVASVTSSQGKKKSKLSNSTINTTLECHETTEQELVTMATQATGRLEMSHSSTEASLDGTYETSSLEVVPSCSSASALKGKRTHSKDRVSASTEKVKAGVSSEGVSRCTGDENHGQWQSSKVSSDGDVTSRTRTRSVTLNAEATTDAEVPYTSLTDKGGTSGNRKSEGKSEKYLTNTSAVDNDDSLSPDNDDSMSPDMYELLSSEPRTNQLRKKSGHSKRNLSLLKNDTATGSGSEVDVSVTSAGEARSCRRGRRNNTSMVDRHGTSAADLNGVSLNQDQGVDNHSAGRKATRKSNSSTNKGITDNGSEASSKSGKRKSRKNMNGEISVTLTRKSDENNFVRDDSVDSVKTKLQKRNTGNRKSATAADVVDSMCEVADDSVLGQRSSCTRSGGRLSKSRSSSGRSSRGTAIDTPETEVKGNKVLKRKLKSAPKLNRTFSVSPSNASFQANLPSSTSISERMSTEGRVSSKDGRGDTDEGCKSKASKSRKSMIMETHKLVKESNDQDPEGDNSGEETSAASDDDDDDDDDGGGGGRRGSGKRSVGSSGSVLETVGTDRQASDSSVASTSDNCVAQDESEEDSLSQPEHDSVGDLEQGGNSENPLGPGQASSSPVKHRNKDSYEAHSEQGSVGSGNSTIENDLTDNSTHRSRTSSAKKAKTVCSTTTGSSSSTTTNQASQESSTVSGKLSECTSGFNQVKSSAKQKALVKGGATRKGGPAKTACSVASLDIDGNILGSISRASDTVSSIYPSQTPMFSFRTKKRLSYSVALNNSAENTEQTLQTSSGGSASKQLSQSSLGSVPEDDKSEEKDQSEFLCLLPNSKKQSSSAMVESESDGDSFSDFWIINDLKQTDNLKKNSKSDVKTTEKEVKNSVVNDESVVEDNEDRRNETEPKKGRKKQKSNKKDKKNATKRSINMCSIDEGDQSPLVTLSTDKRRNKSSCANKNIDNSSVKKTRKSKRSKVGGRRSKTAHVTKTMEVMRGQRQSLPVEPRDWQKSPLRQNLTFNGLDIPRSGISTHCRRVITKKCIDMDKLTAYKDKQNTSTDKQSTSTNKRNTSTDKRNTSTDKQNTSTDKQNTSTNKQNTSTDKRNTSTDKQNTSTDKQNTNMDKRNTSTEKLNTNTNNLNTSVENMNTSTDDLNTSADKLSTSTDNLTMTAAGDIPTATPVSSRTGVAPLRRRPKSSVPTETFLSPCLVQTGSVRSAKAKKRRVTISEIVEKADVTYSHSGSESMLSEGPSPGGHTLGESALGEGVSPRDSTPRRPTPFVRRHSSIGNITGSPVHIFEMTNTETPEPITKPKPSKIIYPKPAPEGLRRSKRVRLRPIEWFKNEHVIYKRRGNCFVISGVEPSREAEYDAAEAARKKKRRIGMRLKQTKSRRLSRGRLLARPNLSMHVVELDDCDYTINPELPVVNPDTQEEVAVDCVSSVDRSMYVGPTGDAPKDDDRYIICHALKQPSFTAGHMLLAPLEEKPMERLDNNTIVFTIMNGKLSVTIHRASCILETGDQFFVPRGNTYSLRNLRDEEAKLSFVNLLENWAEESRH